METRRFTWCAPLVGLLIFLSPLILVVVYFLVRKRCVLAFGLLPSIRRRYRNRLLGKLLVMVATLVATPVAVAIESTPLAAAGAIVFLVAGVALPFGNSPLTITKHRDGEFWIAGCSDGFLAGIGASMSS